MASHYKGTIICRNRVLEFNGKNIKVMGILNITPDSFSDGGINLNKDKAISRAVAMVEDGASIIDIGGESTRPGFVPVSVDEEISRICSVIDVVCHETDAIVSVDTSKPEVAEAALKCGAHIINDVNGFESTEMCLLRDKYNCGAIAMYNNRLGDNKVDVIDRAKTFFTQVSKRINSGLIIDPGIGFGTTPDEDVQLIRNIEEFKVNNNVPLLLALSRKRMIANYMIRESSPQERDSATIGANLAGVSLGADIVRVHDVKGTVDSLRLWEAIMN